MLRIIIFIPQIVVVLLFNCCYVSLRTVGGDL